MSTMPFPPGQDPRKSADENLQDLRTYYGMYADFTGGYGPSPYIGEATFSNLMPWLALAGIAALLIWNKRA